MKTLNITTAFLLAITSMAASQTVEDFFKTETKIIWLGIDYSNVKLIGDFSQFHGAGTKSTYSIKNTYFPAWNELILNEREKYSFSKVLQKSNVTHNIDTITAINKLCNVDDLAAYNSPNYTLEQIKQFVASYNFKKKEAIGILFVAEALNKSSNIGIYHFVAINLSTKEILINERLSGKPSGFGIRNFWAGSVYSTMKLMEKSYKKAWKKKYLK